MPRFSHFLTASLALAALGLGIVVWRQHLEIQRLARAKVPTAEELVARPAPAARRDVVFPKRRAAPVWRGDETELPSEFGAAAGSGRMAEIARLFDNAEFLRALALHQEGSLDLRFAPLFRRLNLTAEELARFKRLLVEKDNAALDVAVASQHMGGAPLSPQAIQAGVQHAHSEVENAIRQSLGQERYEVYASYMTTLPQRVTVMRLERRLSYTDTPLQPAQAETLVSILAQNPASEANARASAVMAGLATDVVPAGLSSLPPANISTAAVSQAAVVLSPPQVTALRQIQTELNAAVEAAEYLNRNASAGAGTGAGGPLGGASSWIRFLLQ